SANQDDPIRYKHTKRRLPQCLIIGVRKGGTRALLEYLGLHPMIQANKKEMHFFDNDDNYSMGLEWYRKKMPHSFREQITIEKTPAYFVSEDTPARVYRLNSSIKLLLVVRDPVKRTISDYTQIAEKELQQNILYKPFEKLAFDPNTGRIRRQYIAIQHSIYHRHIERWLQYFSLNQILILDSRRLVENPAQVVADVERFLGLEHKVTEKNFYFNKTRGFYCMQYVGIQRCLSESKGRTHPKIDPLVLRKLRSFFKLHNQKFFKLIHRTFDWNDD
ncbi:heparan sulfate glucosamine 3-O-sulfotransferase 5-like, partial [Tubulanus polymorphus]|uniref:heparan sulfate glucosamine 3-O-sulfotransferase 5-like n=1 Tax=Tubulanus polymorphus TaxID=672921 RepID=UPI003DA42C91